MQRGIRPGAHAARGGSPPPPPPRGPGGLAVRDAEETPELLQWPVLPVPEETETQKE